MAYRNNCRMCKSEDLEVYLDLGSQVPSDAFRGYKEEVQKKYPLEVTLCKNCGLSQLNYTVDPTELYQNNYPYESSITEGGKRHYFEFANKVVEKFKLTKEELIIDIGSNVGVLLEGFKNNGCKILGIDPAQNIVDKALIRGIPTICEFFGEKIAIEVLDKYGSASVITGTNVFAHVDNLDDFIKGVKTLLNNNGVFIFESPFLMSLVKENAYSSVYHEHLSYLSLKPVKQFMEKYDLEVFHIEERDIHEGSCRVFIAKKGTRYIGDSVGQYLSREDQSGIHDIVTLKVFADKAQKHRIDLVQLVSELRNENKAIALLSCPAKGSTLIQYCGFDTRDIAFGTEKSLLKQGTYVPGTDIQVISDSALLELMPNYAILLAWNFRNEIIKNNLEYLNRGGKIIVPFPKIEIVQGQNVL